MLYQCIGKGCLCVVSKMKGRKIDYSGLFMMFRFSLFAFFFDFSLQHNLKIEDGEDLRHEFERLKQAMEMVGFLSATKKQ